MTIVFNAHLRGDGQMTLKAAVFRTEREAINAVQALERDGFSRHVIKVFAKNTEDTRRIETETDVHADEVQELTETRERSGEDIGWIAAAPLNAPAGLAFNGAVTGMVGGAGPYYGAGVLPPTAALTEGAGMEQSLRALGLHAEAAQLCGEAIADGGIVVAVDVGDGGGMDGGPDMTGAGSAEAVFRSCGAERIL
jgi:hypothetical protein